ncbi:6-hydroxymethylpterin diphosphokinase MptE-like protein [Lacimicrobium sp. SS2-24]|uniref:6-hydroxymethylpterin diphosphokinase MptE-like protein n=1 Tax=Lacimicrobium sp. SS2-24 TaxID=2005569 RepID=UPI000B4BF8F8|nr:6-hydroxymethylpterin diphosphokinase MptE-like protein [Lacimicrobium sp. SS2-24]
MLKNIRLHLQQDEVKQKQQEEQLAAHIAQTSHQNINAFQRHIPSLLPYIQQQSQNISVFCNQYGDYNLVDYGTGRTFYGLHPQDEIQAHLKSFTDSAPYVSFESETVKDIQDEDISKITRLSGLPEYRLRKGAKPLPDAPDLVVVLGIGLGFHIQELIERYQIRHLLVYEPEPQYFKSSTMLIDWLRILQLAKDKGTALFLQIEKDGRDFINNIQELREHVEVEGAYLYQHYNHPVFDMLYQQLTTQPWNTLVEKGLSFRFAQGADEYLPGWTTASKSQTWEDVDADSPRFQQNITAFRKYFPAVYDTFKAYQPKRWLPVQQHNGEVNVVDKRRLVPWYGDSPVTESEINLKGFSEHPHKDGLVLGYNGTKLKHYLHYQFVEKTEAILEQLEEEQGSLPETIKSMILFGMGCGYQVERLFQQHKVEKLFICEPNRDFFYASLFAIDWASILHTIDECDGRLYLNIGDDGTNLFRDLLNQFYAIGPYMLNSTYFYQGYYNGALNQAIAQLREQLRVVISMGEYFDHAYYGIAHTKEALRREYPFMKKDSASLIAAEYQEVPVFLVGNGPSLDFSIEAIKEWQDKAIIVSCGTSLQVLHRNGITPDFHAEIEQNRSTFDWASRIGDLEYLKSISLISCNGIHPDTCDLYKDVYQAFKEGESSTVSTLEVLGKDKYQILEFAFPTVTNFAMNFMAALGMKQIYLLGVDLGFAEKKHHHSKQSGYYKDDGDELYDYSENNNTAIVVQGNFRNMVYTKHEFKVAKMLLEQSLFATKMDCYNCSDGALVSGSTPLKVSDILIVADERTKEESLLFLKEHAFGVVPSSDFETRHSNKFSHKVLQKELRVFVNQSRSKPDSLTEAEALIESQKKLLFLSYQQGQSLLFYYLYGTTNYANSVLTKVLYSSTDKKTVLKRFNIVLEQWQDALNEILLKCKHEMLTYDVTSTFAYQRYQYWLKRQVGGTRLAVVTNSQQFVEVCEKQNEKDGLGLVLKYFDHKSTTDELKQIDHVIIHPNTEEIFLWLQQHVQELSKAVRLVVCVQTPVELERVSKLMVPMTIVYVPGTISRSTAYPQSHDIKRFNSVIRYLNMTRQCHYILPHIRSTKDLKALYPIEIFKPGKWYFYDYNDAVIATKRLTKNEDNVAASGNRGQLIGQDLYAAKMFAQPLLTENEALKIKAQLISRNPILNQEDRAHVQ